MKRLVLTLALSTPAGAAPLKIMPLGDSITEFVKDAENCPQGYRYELWKELVDTGRPFELVGSHSYAAEYGTQYPTYHGLTFQDRNNGWGGWKTADFISGKRGGWGSGRGNVDSWLKEATPDVVLLHVGTNDSWAGVPADEVERNVEAIIDTIQRRAPLATIYLAQIIPMGSKLGGAGALVPVYNQRFAALAKRKANIVLVDQYTGYNADVDNACEWQYNVHPGPSGARKMAAKWTEALRGRL